MNRQWRIELSGSEQDEALRALASVVEADVPLDDISPENFRLPTLGPRLDKVIDEIEGGRGFAVLTGVPIEGLSPGSLEKLFFGLASYIGFAEPQDASGKRLHHVRAEISFKDVDSMNTHFATTQTRGYQTNVELDFHVDGSDALLFLCHRPSKIGGMSKLSSGVTAFNDILSARPDLASQLQQPYAFDARGELGPDRPVQWIPVFSEYRGYLNVLYKRGYIDLAQLMPGVEKMTSLAREAIDYFDTVIRSSKNCLEFMMKPGEILLANNYSILHSRTVFEDYDEPERKRHMLRIWSTLRRNRRPLPPALRTSREFHASAARRRALGDTE